MGMYLVCLSVCLSGSQIKGEEKEKEKRKGKRKRKRIERKRPHAKPSLACGIYDIYIWEDNTTNNLFSFLFFSFFPSPLLPIRKKRRKKGCGYKNGGGSPPPSNIYCWYIWRRSLTDQNSCRGKQPWFSNVCLPIIVLTNKSTYKSTKLKWTRWTPVS